MTVKDKRTHRKVSLRPCDCVLCQISKRAREIHRCPDGDGTCWGATAADFEQARTEIFGLR